MVKSMSYYPVYIKLEKLLCLVVGCGQVGLRKVNQLLEHKAQVRIVCPQELPETLSNNAFVQHIHREFLPHDLIGCTLVFAATSSPEINHNIACLCSAQGILCSVADDGSKGSFMSPLSIQSPSLQIALLSHGGSPAMTQRIGKELEPWLNSRYTQQLALLERLRPHIKQLVCEQKKRAEILRSLSGQKLEKALHAHDRPACEKLLLDILPQELWQLIPETLHELV